MVTTIALERNRLKNHRVTRVIMPNGERFVFDYWEGMSNHEPRIYTEKEWIDKWKKEMGGNPQLGKRSSDEDALKKNIEDFGEKKGIEMFRRMAILMDRMRRNQNPGCPSYRIQEAESVIRSYRRNPW